MTLTLYYHPFSSYSWKALIPLYEAGTPFTPRSRQHVFCVSWKPMQKLLPILKVWNAGSLCWKNGSSRRSKVFPAINAANSEGRQEVSRAPGCSAALCDERGRKSGPSHPVSQRIQWAKDLISALF